MCVKMWRKSVCKITKLMQEYVQATKCCTTKAFDKNYVVIEVTDILKYLMEELNWAATNLTLGFKEIM